MRKFKKAAFVFAFLLFSIFLSSSLTGINNNGTSVFAQEGEQKYRESEIGNPILPGYFADPSAYKFGDTFYIYATSCGYHVGQEAGWPMVWSSKDFVNWKAKKLIFKTQKGRDFNVSGGFWAPSAIEHNGKYYISFTYNDYYTYIAESDAPDGEYTILGQLNSKFFKSKTIDSQFFRDDDGRIYITFLWNINNVIYSGIAELDPNDFTNVLEMKRPPELKGPPYREGQELLKKDGKYYLLYSEGVWTGSNYHVRYSVADNIYGPYENKGPILVSRSQDGIEGTGHHSILKLDDRYIMVYHRQSLPIKDYVRRQTCANEIFFNEDGTIIPIQADHKGVGYLGVDEEAEKYTNIAGEAKVIVEESFEDFKPEHINDSKYSTLWKSVDDSFPKSFTLDFQEEKEIAKTELYFEYPSKYYQYKIEYSNDNENWELYSDKTENEEAISPHTDLLKVNARYLKVTITGMERMTGAYGGSHGKPKVGIVEMKVFEEVPPPADNDDIEKAKGDILVYVVIGAAVLAVAAAWLIISMINKKKA